MISGNKYANHAFHTLFQKTVTKAKTEKND